MLRGNRMNRLCFAAVLAATASIGASQGLLANNGQDGRSVYGPIILKEDTPNVTYGEMTLTFGYATMPNGEKVPVEGITIPYKAERIYTRKAGPSSYAERFLARFGNRMPNRGGGASGGFDGGGFDIQSFAPATNVYSNDQGAASYVQLATPEFPNPSSLDDVTLTAAGNGQAWTEFTIGFAPVLGASGLSIVRWRCWDSEDPTATDPDVPLFINELFDFGGFFDVTPYAGGAAKVTFDLSGTPLAIIPDGQGFLATQWREPDPSGEGPFRTDVQIVYSISGPSLGTSADLFYFDFPANGVYDFTELEQLQGVTGSNILYTMAISDSGSTQTYRPDEFVFLRGSLVSGTRPSLYFDDNNNMVGKPGPVLVFGSSPCQLQIDAFVPSNAITGVRLDVRSSTSTSNIEQVVEFWDFVDGEWEEVGRGPMTPTETYGQFLGKVATPATNYVHPTQLFMRARLSYKQTGPVLVMPWNIRVDQTEWTVQS